MALSGVSRCQVCCDKGEVDSFATPSSEGANYAGALGTLWVLPGGMIPVQPRASCQSLTPRQACFFN